MKSSKRPFDFQIRAQASGRYAITIRGIIGEYVDYERWTISDTEKDVLNELKQIPQDAAIDCRINSRGATYSGRSSTSIVDLDCIAFAS